MLQFEENHFAPQKRRPLFSLSPSCRIWIMNFPRLRLRQMATSFLSHVLFYECPLLPNHMITNPLKMWILMAISSPNMSHLESILWWVYAVVCGTCLYFVLVHLLQDCERLRYWQRPQIPHIFTCISIAVRASLTQLLTYLSGIDGRVLVVPPNPDEFIESATKEMNVSGNKLWGVKRLFLSKELLIILC